MKHPDNARTIKEPGNAANNNRIALRKRLHNIVGIQYHTASEADIRRSRFYVILNLYISMQDYADFSCTQYYSWK